MALPPSSASETRRSITGQEMSRLATMIWEFLQPLMVSHDKLDQKCLMSPFTSEKCPSMPIRDYIIRIIRYFRFLSKGAMVGAAIILKRVVQRDNNVELSPMTCHRLILTSLVISSKFTEDFFDTNSYYAHVGGIETHELNALEREFLNAINFELYVSPKEFQLAAAAILVPPAILHSPVQFAVEQQIQSQRASDASADEYPSEEEIFQFSDELEPEHPLEIMGGEKSENVTHICARCGLSHMRSVCCSHCKRQWSQIATTPHCA